MFSHVQADVTGGSHIRGVQAVRPKNPEASIITNLGCVHSGLLVFEATTGKMANNPLSSTLSHSCGSVKADVTGGTHTPRYRITDKMSCQKTIGSQTLRTRACGVTKLSEQTQRKAVAHRLENEELCQLYAVDIAVWKQHKQWQKQCFNLRFPYCVVHQQRVRRWRKKRGGRGGGCQ